MICLAMDIIDNLILYLGSKEEHALNISMEVLIIIFFMIARLISRLSCSGWEKLMVVNIC